MVWPHLGGKFLPSPCHDHFLPPSPTAPSCIQHHVDNVSTPAIAPAHSAQHAQPTNLSPGPLAPSLPPRQHHFQTSTKGSTAREAYPLQPTIASRSATPPQQTACLSSALERQREGTAEDEAVPPHDATRGHLFPLVPHESHHPRVDHHGELILIVPGDRKH